MRYIDMPVQVEWILRVLHDAGYEAYIVGGCVRDAVLGKEPHDWDITTSASPEQVKKLFPRTVDTGIAHGTVTILVSAKDLSASRDLEEKAILLQEKFIACEVTTFRIDGAYEDSRHPSEVTFTPDLLEDLKRRDFTINAMAYSHETGLVDAFHGIKDLQKKIIRCVGDPRKRFGEDALRMMRAVRFAAQLGFEIDPDTQEAIREMAENLDRISAERIREELVKLVSSPHPAWFRLAYTTGITSIIMPEFDRMMVQSQNSPHHLYTVGEHTLVAMENVRPDPVLRLTLLFHDLGKPDVVSTDQNGVEHFHGHARQSRVLAERIMRRLKFDNDTMRQVLMLVEKHSMFPQLSAREIRHAAYEIGPDLFDRFLEVKRADILAHHPDLVRKNLDYLEQVIHIWDDICIHHDCLSLKELKLNGDDLRADGMKPGKAMGEVLSRLLFEVLDHPEINSREYLLAQSRRLREEIYESSSPFQM